MTRRHGKGPWGQPQLLGGLEWNLEGEAARKPLGIGFGSCWDAQKNQNVTQNTMLSERKIKNIGCCRTQSKKTGVQKVVSVLVILLVKSDGQGWHMGDRAIHEQKIH